MTYIDDDGIEGEIALPAWPDNFDQQVTAAFDQAVADSVNLVITVQRSMGFEQIMTIRQDRS